MNPSNLASRLRLYRQKLGGVISVLIFIGVALLPWYIGSTYFILFIVLCCISIIMFRKRTLSLIVVPFLVVMIIFTRVPDTLTKIKESDLEIIQTPQEVFTNIFTGGTGREVLPIPVQQMLTLMERNNIRTYQLSAQFSQDPEISQRIIESSWPLRYNPESQFVLFAPSEKTSYLSHCVLIDEREEVALGKCN